MVDVPGEDPKFGKGSNDEVLFLGVGRLKALRMAFLTQPSKRGIPRSDRAIPRESYRSKTSLDSFGSCRMLLDTRERWGSSRLSSLHQVRMLSRYLSNLVVCMLLLAMTGGDTITLALGAEDLSWVTNCFKRWLTVSTESSLRSLVPSSMTKASTPDACLWILAKSERAWRMVSNFRESQEASARNLLESKLASTPSRRMITLGCFELLTGPLFGLEAAAGGADSVD